MHRRVPRPEVATPEVDENKPPPRRLWKPRGKRSGCLACVRGCALFFMLALALGGVALLAANDFSPATAADACNFWLMRFFRDLSRAKARRRRFNQKGALMTLMLGKEEALPLGDASAGLSLTLEELSEYDGRLLPDSTERAAVLLAIKGRIYDVSAGQAFYGPGRSYHKLTGKDATRAFCTGCLDAACLISSTRGLSAKQLREADRWIELYEHHDKYKLVGQVRKETAAQRALGESTGEEDGADEAVAAAATMAMTAEEEAREEELVKLAQTAETRKAWRPFRLR